MTLYLIPTKVIGKFFRTCDYENLERNFSKKLTEVIIEVGKGKMKGNAGKMKMSACFLAMNFIILLDFHIELSEVKHS